MLTDEAGDLFGTDSLRRSLLHHPPSLIYEPVRFPDVREGSPFCRFGVGGLERADDLGLQAPGLMVEERCEAIRPRLRRRLPGQIVRKREAKFETVGAALDVLHPRHHCMVP